MNINEILSRVDHTLLSQTATEAEIIELCDDAVKYKTATVCIPASYIGFVKKKYGDLLKICTVIGFPNGYSTTACKCFEATDAVLSGADEIDMVINIGWLKDKKYNEISDEINAVKKACEGKLLKVIIETCLLTDEEKIKMCEIVSETSADFIKTSTGFSLSGATPHDIQIFKKHIKNGKKIQAAGGIKTLQDAAQFISLGADRLGTSRIVKVVKERENNNEPKNVSDSAY